MRLQGGAYQLVVLSDSCVDRIIIDFMDKGNARDLDTTCVEQMALPLFPTSSAK